MLQIFFTSGTTGEPKMVVHNHSYAFALGITGKYWFDLTNDDLHWNLSDNGWAKMAWSGLFAPWSQASGVFIHEMDKFEPVKIVKTLMKYPITSICAAPTLYRSLVVEKDIKELKPVNEKNSRSVHLRQCLSAGEPLNEEVINKWKEYTNIPIREGYGQTETTLIAGTFRGMEIKPGSMGKPGPGYNVVVVDDKGIAQAAGIQGNIAVDCRNTRPAGLFKEYLDDPVRTNGSMLGDYYITGDKGYKDEDGYIWFVSRSDDVIISSGYRIGPFEVESALISHPAVLESAAVASPDTKRGMVVKAFVVLSESAKSELKGAEKNILSLKTELQEHCKTVTAPYKYPRKIDFVDSLPKTISGKIQRVKLRQLELEKTRI